MNVLQSFLAVCFLFIKTVQAAGYIAFYSDSKCRTQVGRVHYSLHNQGCFSNGGPYLKVVNAENGVDGPYSFVVSQSKAADCKGGLQNQATFEAGAVNVCRNLSGSKFITGGNGVDHPYSVQVIKG